MLRRSLRLPPPRTLLPFSMLEILPDQTKSLEDNLSRGLQRLAFLDGRAKGQYVLKVGDTPITRAEDVPADPELLCVEARDDLARAEMVCFLARRDANMIKRTNDLRYLDKNDIPDVVLASTQQKTTQENNNVRKALNDIYVKCELSEVVPLPALEKEDVLVGSIFTNMRQETKDKKDNSFFRQRIRTIGRCAKRLKYRVNKPFFRAKEDDWKKRQQPCLFTTDNEQTYCDLNVLFFVEVKQINKATKSAKTKKPVKMEEEEEEALLREGVQQVISRLINRQDYSPFNPARVGLGLVCNSKRLLCVRVDLQKERIPVFVSRAVDPNSTEGLRLLVRFLCNTSREAFGLPKHNVFELRGLQYVRALGSGGFADVAVVLDDNKEEEGECVCKMIRDSSDEEDLRILEAEAKALKKLAGIDGVPTLVRAEADKLFTRPVLMPLAQHLRTMSEVQRKSFAERVLVELRVLLAAVHARGMIHGDVHPGNLAVGDNEKLFLIDWGSAIDTSEPGNEQQQQRCGRTLFMSDELLNGAEPSPDDDFKALLFTYLAILDNPSAAVPWPELYQFCVDDVIHDRTRWLQSYTAAHPELDLSLVLPPTQKS